MAKKPDTPCAGCGKLLWTRNGSLPAGERTCRDCRRAPAEPTLDEPAPPVEAWRPGSGLGRRGRALWCDMDGASLDVAHRVLLEEACRLADRCDRLDDFLRGREDTWLRFHALNEDASTVKVVINGALSEARQQQATLKALLVELRAKIQTPKSEASRRDELAKRREDRRRAAGL